jgi:tetratricopeptide (TPR) repeat protein
MAWDPEAADSDPRILARRAEIAYGAQLVLYPAPTGNHSALALLLSGLTDDRFPPSGKLPADLSASAVGPRTDTQPEVPVRWIPPAQRVTHFAGRAEELTRLNRWAADPQVALIGVTAWGGAGKTALVTHWIEAMGGAGRRAGLRGVFGWSFYADPSAEHWAHSLLEWARRDLGIAVAGTGRLAAAVLGLLQAVPLLLVLDGLEVLQEGPAGDGFGRLLDGTLREVLADACQREHAGLVVLTSRFPFADLETFDGGAARMLEVPPFTPTEGSALLVAAGGGWLPDDQRRALVWSVDGHALATEVLAGLLAARPPVGDLDALRADLAAATRTDARVGRVLRFYADRLSDADRYLLAAVSLFARPVPADAVLAAARHEAFGDRLAGWTSAMVQAAVRDRLGGLASWHPDGTISAHPLIRDTFRPLVIAAAETAADITVAGLPSGAVTSRADALRLVEAIELLLDADQWQPADNMYVNRSGNGRAWTHLPAARLGQRAAAAFVATPARRAGCAAQLSPDRLRFYLNDVGLSAMNAGDLPSAQNYLSIAVDHSREAGDAHSLVVGLQNLAQCLSHLGQASSARTVAAEALTRAETTGNRGLVSYSLACLGRAAALAGDVSYADRQFTAADQVWVDNHTDGTHLHSLAGIWWADWLDRTGRDGSAQALTRRNADVSRQQGGNADVARCDRLLGRMALAAGDTAVAGEHLASAAASFRDGDYLVELAETNTVLASYALATGDLDAAERYTAEAITIAAPRGLVPVHCAALAARARIRVAQANATTAKDLLLQGRDAADAALRLAVRHQLSWHELDALRAHALIDAAEHVDHGWASRADALYAQLLPPDPDPHPLASLR